MKKIIFVFVCSLISSCFVYAGIDEAKAAIEAKNYPVVFKELKPLAENGDSAAQNYLAHMYEDGVGTLKNNEQAVFWYTKASEQGHENAQFNLGIIYYNGLIVKENTVLGYALVATAAANRDELAIDFVKHMSGGYPGKISKTQVQEAQKLSQQLLLSSDYQKTIEDYFKK